MPGAVFIPTRLNDLISDVAITGVASGDILYRGASKWTNLAKGANGQFLTLAAGLPAWGTVATGLTIDTTTITGGTIGRVLYHESGNVVGEYTISGTGSVAMTGSPTFTGTVTANTGAAGTIGQVIKGAASQTADLQQWQKSDATVLAKITAAGQVMANSFARSQWTTDTDGASITFDLTYDLHKVTLGGNRTLVLSNPTTAQSFMIKLTQDGTGSRTVTWFAGITWPGGVVPTLTTTAGKSDTFMFNCTAANAYDGFVVAQNQ